MPTIRKRNGQFQVQVRLKGHAPLSETFQHYADAKAWGLEQERKLKLTGMPVTRKELQAVSLKKLIADYLDCAIFTGKRSSANERIALEAFLERETSLCSKSLAEITQKDFAAYRDRRLETIKPSTLRRELNPLRSMFRIARREWNLPIDNPLQGLWLPPEGEPRQRRLSPREENKLSLAALYCRGETQASLWTSMLFAALQTGLRRGELLNLQWGDIDFARKTLRVRPGKTGRGRILPLSSSLKQHLERYRSKIPEERRAADAKIYPISVSAHSQAWRRIAQRAGVKDLTFHDLRHEAANWFAEIGLTYPEYQHILGHDRKRDTTSRYLHVENLDSIRAKLDAGERVVVVTHR